MSITPSQRSRVLERDLWCCAACGTSDGLTIQHRVSRGMGGSKLFEGYAYWLTLCGYCNARLEHDAEFAEKGRQMGWKLHRNRKTNPTDEPIIYCGDPRQWYLTDDGERVLDEPKW